MGTCEHKVNNIFIRPLMGKPEGQDLSTESLPKKTWNTLGRMNQARAANPAEAPPQQFLSWEKYSYSHKILSLLLFLQAWPLPWLLLWSLHSVLNTGRRKFESDFIILCVTIHLSSFPALKHCWSTDWSRILKRSEKQDSLQSHL